MMTIVQRRPAVKAAPVKTEAEQMPVRRTQFDWTPEREALLRQRWAEGASGGTIARELGHGVSKGAVLGKASRLGLPRRAVPVGFRKRSWS